MRRGVVPRRMASLFASDLMIESGDERHVGIDWNRTTLGAQDRGQRRQPRRGNGAARACGAGLGGIRAAVAAGAGRWAAGRHWPLAPESDGHRPGGHWWWGGLL